MLACEVNANFDAPVTVIDKNVQLGMVSSQWGPSVAPPAGASPPRSLGEPPCGIRGAAGYRNLLAHRLWIELAGFIPSIIFQNTMNPPVGSARTRGPKATLVRFSIRSAFAQPLSREYRLTQTLVRGPSI